LVDIEDLVGFVGVAAVLEELYVDVDAQGQWVLRLLRFCELVLEVLPEHLHYAAGQFVELAELEGMVPDLGLVCYFLAQEGVHVLGLALLAGRLLATVLEQLLEEQFEFGEGLGWVWQGS
jgi:hypothetical protein